MLDQTPSVKPHAVSRALLAGFISATIMTYVFAIGYWLATYSPRFLGAGQTEFAAWCRNLSYNFLVEQAHAWLWVALTFHLLLGLGWAVVYGLVFEHRLQGSAAVRGMKFSLLPWLLSIIVFFPLMGAGFLGSHLGAGPLPVIGNLVLHLCYGLVLGLAYGPLGDAVVVPGATDNQLESAALSGSTHRAAQGLVLGLLVGGLVGTSLMGSTPEGMTPTYMMVAGLVLGGALGCLAGALTGLPTKAPKRAPEHKS
ncbi:MAG TPA: DUF6789 family protein [Candidatus Xenobia bacterium]|jgi:hypothetical protein